MSFCANGWVSIWIILAGLDLTRERGDQLPTASPVTVFAEINSLPDAKVKASFGNWHSDRTAKNHSFYMGWHIVRAFEDVRVMAGVLWSQLIEVRFQIAAHAGIGVLV